MKAKISDYLLGIIFFTLFITAGVSILSIFKQSNPDMGGTVFSEYNQTFNKLDAIQNRTNTLSEGMTDDSKIQEGKFGFMNGLIVKSVQSVKLIGQDFSFMTGVFMGLPAMFGIPNFVVIIITSMITIILVFTIWGAMVQREL